MEDGTLKAWKDLAAHNFIPKALVVGVLGNLINFVMLSRYAIKLVIYLSIFQILALRQAMHQEHHKHLSVDIGLRWHILYAAHTRAVEAISRWCSSPDTRNILADVRSHSLVLHRFSWVPNVAVQQKLKLNLILLFSVYITVYVTLSLTLDRYAAVRHPARARYDIARAKNVVSSKLFAPVFRGFGANYFPFLLSSILHVNIVY